MHDWPATRTAWSDVRIPQARLQVDVVQAGAETVTQAQHCMWLLEQCTSMELVADLECDRTSPERHSRSWYEMSLLTRSRRFRRGQI